MARSDYIDPTELRHVLAALTPPNRLALEVSLATGLRIGDVLAIRTEQLSGSDGRMTIAEQKTGKHRRVRIPKDLHERMAAQAGRVFVWQHRTSRLKPRSRQAVYKDLRRVARLMRVKLILSPHTARKAWAVGLYPKVGLKRLQGLLNHSSEAVTMLYALADEMTARKRGVKR